MHVIKSVVLQEWGWRGGRGGFVHVVRRDCTFICVRKIEFS
jgi:hypothetical protein